MSNEADISRARVRAANILKSSICRQIRFKLDNISIQTYMYSYVAGLITDDHVHISIDSSNHYDYVSNTITFESADVKAVAIVHEATHAVIDATTRGKVVTKGTQETAAYLAETLFALLSGDEPDSDVQGLTPPLADLAKQVLAFNKSNQSGLFVCPLANTEYIKKVLGSSRLAGDQNRTDKMDGVPYQSGGLIWRMRQDARAASSEN